MTCLQSSRTMKPMQLINYISAFSIIAFKHSTVHYIAFNITYSRPIMIISNLQLLSIFPLH